MDRRGSEPSVRPGTAESREEARAALPAARALGEWLQQLARAIKTSRLYDASNPAIATLRRDLAAALEALLAQFGSVEMSFTPDSIVSGETPLHLARSREDNLSLPFFRDGIRSMTIHPGITASEVGALLDALLAVTKRGGEEVDLVTLLWESGLEHVTIRYVSTEGDVETGGDAGVESATGADAAGAVAPWPKPGTAEPSAAGGGSSAGGAAEITQDDTGRSDDRVTSNRTRDLEKAFVELEIGGDSEVARFRTELEAEAAIPLARGVLGLMITCFRHATRESDRDELRLFVPRLLHDSVSHGEWAEARQCLYLLRDPHAGRDLVADFQRDVARADSSTSRSAWKVLDHHSPEQHELFFELARELGPASTDWVMHGIAESQRQQLRRGLARTLAGILADDPERLAPWLSDERWYVVRNAVHVLTLRDGAPPVEMLRAVADHSDPRVRREVVTALARAPRAQSRPLLLAMLKIADARLSTSILHQLASEPDPQVAALLLEQMDDPSFLERPEEERRAIAQTIAATGGDSAVPMLEAHVHHGNWFQRGDEELRITAALCLARIGTPAARRVLEAGEKSRRGEVSRACRAALTAAGASGGGGR